MPGNGHTIFFRGCGHVLLARPQALGPEFSNSGTPSIQSRDSTSKSETQYRYGSYAPPHNYPCNTHTSLTPSMSPPPHVMDARLYPKASECRLWVPISMILRVLTYSPRTGSSREANVKVEGSLRDATLCSLKSGAKESSQEKTSEREKEVQQEEENIDDL
jgi:hypothetical protein